MKSVSQKMLTPDDNRFYPLTTSTLTFTYRSSNVIDLTSSYHKRSNNVCWKNRSTFKISTTLLSSLKVCRTSRTVRCWFNSLFDKFVDSRETTKMLYLTMNYEIVIVNEGWFHLCTTSLLCTDLYIDDKQCIDAIFLYIDDKIRLYIDEILYVDEIILSRTQIVLFSTELLAFLTLSRFISVILGYSRFQDTEAYKASINLTSAPKEGSHLG